MFLDGQRAMAYRMRTAVSYPPQTPTLPLRRPARRKPSLAGTNRRGTLWCAMREYDVLLVQERRELMTSRGVRCAPPPAEKGVNALSAEDRATLVVLANGPLRDQHEGRVADAALTANEYAREVGEYWPMGAEGVVRAGMELAADWRAR